MRFFSFYLVLILAETIMGTVDIDPHKLVAVSEYEIAAFLYYRLRNQRRYTNEPPLMHPNTRNRICHYITGSTLFKNVFQENRAYMYQIHTYLSILNPSIFYSLYEQSSDSNLEDEMVYVNRPRLIEVFNDIIDDDDSDDDDDDHTVFEYVFTCLTIDYHGDLAVYHVSEEYNLSDTIDSYLPGRFLFYGYFDDEKSITDVFTVAEVPARSLSTPGKDVERLYLQKNGKKEPVNNQSEDRICMMTEYERLRVCNLIFTSAYFEEELKFIPQFRNDDILNCIKRSISFEDEDVKLEIGQKQYEERMISCRPEQYYASYQAEYFLSRVHDAKDEVFVYRWEDNNSRIIIENLFADVRFIV